MNKEKVELLKEKLKYLADSIKSDRAKGLRDDFQKTECRHHHIVYGMLRGVPLEAMEKKCRTPLEKMFFNRIEKEYELGLDYDEALRYSRSVLV